MSENLFHLILIKPSNYDDDGYPIQWVRSSIPSNTLAAMSGLALYCKSREVLGSGVELRIVTIDETNARVLPGKIIREIKNAGGRALIGLVGVQSNQFSRACDLSKPFIDAGLNVMGGGFHVSGCISMLAELPQEIRDLQDTGVSLCAGELENGRLDDILRDAYRGELRPLYNYMADLPSIDGEPVPFLPVEMVARTEGRWTSFDLGRGCPFQCSFCTIINVQGRKSRFRTADDLERIVRVNIAQGIQRFFITDDNFARNRDWEVFFDKLIELREEHDIKIKLIIQVDTLCHEIPRFVEKAGRAGVNKVFIGLENINPENLLAAKKRQNRITEYRKLIQAWRDHRVTIYAGYILGFPADTKESILQDIEIIKRELAIDVLEFFYLTPLPGSEDHQKLHKAGVWMDPDFNKYDLNHQVSHHPKMSTEEWDDAYRAAWASFYSREHMVTVAKRAASLPNGRTKAKLKQMLWFSLMYFHEGVHPLEGGIFRYKFRKDRRPGLPLENPISFYARYGAGIVRRVVYYAWRYHSTYQLWTRTMADKERFNYTDIAIAAPRDDDLEGLEMFTETSGGQEAVAKKHADEVRREKILGRVAAE
jgi:radical SAM superfamily enzyme YgiQ (UPF0313 family)